MKDGVKIDDLLCYRPTEYIECQDDGVRPSKDWVRNHLDRLDERPLSTGITGTRVSLDKNTLKWRAWTSSGISSVPSEGVHDDNAFVPTDNYENILGKKVYLYQPFYKLTANDYRKLNNQIRDTASSPVVRKNSSTFKKYSNPRCGDNVTKLYRSQLASSLKAFDERRWQTYENEAGSVVSSRSRPASSLSETRCTQSRPGSSRVSMLSKARCRPQSSPAPRLITATPLSTSSQQQQQQQQQHQGQSEGLGDETLQVRSFSIGTKHANNYDCLTQEIVYELTAGPKPESVYGDRSESALARLDELDEESRDGDDGSPAGDTAEEKRQDDKQQEQTTENKSDSGESSADKRLDSADGDMSDKDTDLDSDEEDYPEPPVERMNLCDLPNLSLRPEKMDALDLPVYGRGDRRKYDFDASHVDYPPCEFAAPLPKGMESVNLREMSLSERNWREQTKARPEAPGEEYIIDRLIEFERLQARTVEWELAKQERARSTRQRQTRSKIYPQSRVQSAKTWREKKCCVDCLQMACVGDCPSKLAAGSNQCPTCAEKHCQNNSCCGLTVYECRSRAECDDEKPKPKPKYRPRSCATCQQRHNAKLINANNLVLGRPKSGHATFARGQSSLKPRDVRLKSAATSLSKELQIEFENLGLDPEAPEESSKESDPASRPGTAGSLPRRSGRAGVLPGKSFFSQRRASLTEKEYSCERARSVPTKRVKSSRRKRPNTAAL